MALNTIQLRKLGDKLKIKFSSSMRKGALRSQIITYLGLLDCSSSSRAVEKVDKPQPWSPPKIKPNWKKESSLSNYHSTEQVCVEKMVANESVSIEKGNRDTNKINPKVVDFKRDLSFVPRSSPAMGAKMDKIIKLNQVRNSLPPSIAFNGQLSSQLQEYEQMCNRIRQKEKEWLKREEALLNSLKTYKKEVCNLKGQVSKLVKQRDQLQSKTPSPCISSLSSILASEKVCSIEKGNSRIGLVMKIGNLKKYLESLQNCLSNWILDSKKSLIFGVGEGSCNNARFPVAPRPLTPLSRTILSDLNEEFGRPGVNVVGMLKLSSSGINVSDLLKTNPMNVIWVNAGESPIIVKLLTNHQENKTMLLNPGLALVLGKQKLWKDIVFSSLPDSLDNLYEANSNHHQSHVLCFTAGTDVPDSWLNALNSDNAGHPESKSPHCNANRSRKRPSIRERLVNAGIELRKKIAIRVAPLKSSDLPFDYLNSKIRNMEKWVADLKSLHPNLVLPELDKVKAEWEKPREGKRFRILRIYFKSATGLDTLFDLLYGSKIDLVDGFPEELVDIRDKIHLSLGNPHRREVGQRL